MEIFKQLRTFVLETDAFVGLEAKMMMTRVAEAPFKPIFQTLNIEWKLDKLRDEGDKKITAEFYKDMVHARK